MYSVGGWRLPALPLLDLRSARRMLLQPITPVYSRYDVPPTFREPYLFTGSYRAARSFAAHQSCNVFRTLVLHWKKPQSLVMPSWTANPRTAEQITQLPLHVKQPNSSSCFGP